MKESIRLGHEYEARIGGSAIEIGEHGARMPAIWIQRADIGDWIAMLERAKQKMGISEAPRRRREYVLAQITQWLNRWNDLIIVTAIMMFALVSILFFTRPATCWYVSPEVAVESPWADQIYWALRGKRAYSLDGRADQNFQTQLDAWQFLTAHTERICR